MKFTVEQLESNFNILLDYIEKYITGERKQKLLNFYNQYAERIAIIPASQKKEYHNCFPGGYVDHVIRVIECSLKQHQIWEEMGANTSTYTLEELIFSALNHDLGKLGDKDNDAYIPQTDKWRRDKLGEQYMFNEQLTFISVPDRSLFLLQQHGIQYSQNEMLAILTHDGIYDEANKKYFISYRPETKPRSALPYILHQADLMAARIEFEREWLPKFVGSTKNVQSKLEGQNKNETLHGNNKQPVKNKALGKLKNPDINEIFNSF